MTSEYVAAIDIGTTKICALLAKIDEQGRVTVVGFGMHPSYGLKKGIVVNIATTVESIKKALQAAEKEAGVAIDRAVVGIAGSHIRSFNSVGVVGIGQRDVSQYDIDRVIDAAKAVPIEQDREILHVIPQYFCVDGQEMVHDSLGMHGVRLEAQVHIVTGAISSAQNIVKAVEMAGVRVLDIVLEQLASAEAVLTTTEKELGVGMVDIGGGTSDFAVYKDGKIRYSKVFPVAGNHLTNDIAIAMGLSLSAAEEVKRQYGAATQAACSEVGTLRLRIPRDGEEGTAEITTYELLEVIAPRAEELCLFMHDEIMKNRLTSNMPSGLVMTGGGSLLRGMPHLAHTLLQQPVRIGLPLAYTSADGALTSELPDYLRSPQFSTVYGLLAFAFKKEATSFMRSDAAPLMSKVLHRMKTWIYDFL
jgi:cell division protein FtsA